MAPSTDRGEETQNAPRAGVLSGSYGTKLEAIVEHVQGILEADPEDKVLLFSTWQDVLELLAHAFRANNVPFVYGKGRSGLQDALVSFRDPCPDDWAQLSSVDVGAQAWAAPPAIAAHGATSDSAPVQPEGGAPALSAAGAAVASPSSSKRPRARALRAPGAAHRAAGHRGPAVEAPRVIMLLLKQAGAGLNLTEAQHAILVEPTTNPALEAQAIGRVHRIGQTRDTHVHRFVVDDTVEASVAKLTAAKAANMDMGLAVSTAVAAEPQLTLGDVAVMLFAPREGQE